MTFSNYKNCNRFKGLVGISFDGVVTFVSHLFAGSILDKELTREREWHFGFPRNMRPCHGRSGFDVEDYLIL